MQRSSSVIIVSVSLSRIRSAFTMNVNHKALEVTFKSSTDHVTLSNMMIMKRLSLHLYRHIKCQNSFKRHCCNYVRIKSFHAVAPHTRSPLVSAAYIILVGMKATLRTNPQTDEESCMWSTEMLLSWHQGLSGMSQGPRAVTCSVPVSRPWRRTNGQTDRVRLWCQYGS